MEISIRTIARKMVPGQKYIMESVLHFHKWFLDFFPVILSVSSMQCSSELLTINHQLSQH